MLQADEGVAYYCVLNKNGKSNRRTSVKKILSSWISAIDELNSDTGDNAAIISSNDIQLAFLDRWCVSLGRDATINTYGITDVYEEKALRGKITVNAD